MRSWETLRITGFCVHDAADTKEARVVSHWRLLFGRDFGLIWLSQLCPKWRRYLEPCAALVRVFDYGSR